ncbi:MAG: hypothetical protein SFZ23_04915 [Planctomycetota bacterium]|nr:hypothetical protein [Planctomycetota bacterium]
MRWSWALAVASVVLTLAACSSPPGEEAASELAATDSVEAPEAGQEPASNEADESGIASRVPEERTPPEGVLGPPEPQSPSADADDQASASVPRPAPTRAAPGLIRPAIPGQAVRDPELTANIPGGRVAGTPGLELVWFRVPDPGYSPFALMLSPFEERRAPIARGLWREHGLRLLSLPAEDARRLETAFARVGPMQRQALGQLPAWTPAIVGPAWGERRSIRVADGVVDVGAGRMRLLLRCWLEATFEASPDAAGGLPVANLPRTVLRVELLPQQQDVASRKSDPASVLLERLERDSASTPLDQGLNFERLYATFTLNNAEAIVIVPEAPEVDWARERERAAAARPESPAGTGEVGPVPVYVPTPGEALLTESGVTGTSRTRVVIILHAHVPG